MHTTGCASNRNKIGGKARLFSKNVIVQFGWIVMVWMQLFGDIGSGVYC